MEKRAKAPVDPIPEARTWLPDGALASGVQNGGYERAGGAYTPAHQDAKMEILDYIALRKSRSPHDAEDMRAETFLRVLQAIRSNQLRSAGSLGSFILGTTRNVLRELFLRQRKAGQTTQADEADLSVPSHEKLFLDFEVQRAVERTIERLKPRERDLLRMHFYEELSSQEIARRAGIAPERVRLIKLRALKHFREERYARDQLPPEERRTFEEHFFTCSECFEKLQTTERFIAGVRDAAERGLL